MLHEAFECMIVFKAILYKVDYLLIHHYNCYDYTMNINDIIIFIIVIEDCDIFYAI